MNSYDVSNTISRYNATNDKVLDRCTDILIHQFCRDLDRLYQNNRWAEMIDAHAIGFCMSSISDDFNHFNYGAFEQGSTILYIFKLHKTIEWYELISFQKFIDDKMYKDENINFEIGEYTKEDILFLVPFINKMEEKGFKTYVSIDEQALVFIVDVPEK